MGLFAKLISYTPFDKYYKAYNHRKWLLSQQREEEKLKPARIAFYRQFIQPGDLVFDVGANVGNRVEAFLDCGARVVAVEPQPRCVSILKEKFGNRITIVESGLGEKEDVLEMHLASDSTVSSFDSGFIRQTKEKFRYTEWQGTIWVPVTTLDRVVDTYGCPRFCKIDVEGFELQVLKGLHRPIPCLSLEYCVPEMKERLLGCIDRLHEVAGKGMFNYSVQESMQLALDQWMAYEAFRALVLTPAFDHTLFGDIYFKTV